MRFYLRVDPAIAYVKSAAVLKPDGSLAVFSNTHIHRDEGFFLRVQDLYRKSAPSLTRASTNTNRDYGEPASTLLFGDPIVRSYKWTAEYSAKEYIDLLGTYSDHISLLAGYKIIKMQQIQDYYESLTSIHFFVDAEKARG